MCGNFCYLFLCYYLKSFVCLSISSRRFMGPYAQAVASGAHDTKDASLGSQVSVTDLELLPTVLFQAFRTRNCNRNTGRARS